MWYTTLHENNNKPIPGSGSSTGIMKVQIFDGSLNIIFDKQENMNVDTSLDDMVNVAMFAGRLIDERC